MFGQGDQTHLFFRFHRGRNASAYPGSGLDLAIVKAIADQLRASITVESGPFGTKFDTFGSLIVADAYKGVLSISQDGTLKVLTNEIDGNPIIHPIL